MDMLHIEPYRDADRLQTAALIYAAFCDKFQRARRLSARLGGVCSIGYGVGSKAVAGAALW
ncbi:hypothetical protein M8494_18165 [Serratia ureilytica]